MKKKTKKTDKASIGRAVGRAVATPTKAPPVATGKGQGKGGKGASSIASGKGSKAPVPQGKGSKAPTPEGKGKRDARKDCQRFTDLADPIFAKMWEDKVDQLPDASLQGKVGQLKKVAQSMGKDAPEVVRMVKRPFGCVIRVEKHTFQIVFNPFVIAWEQIDSPDSAEGKGKGK